MTSQDYVIILLPVPFRQFLYTDIRTPVCEMTYNVSSGTSNSTIPYRTCDDSFSQFSFIESAASRYLSTCVVSRPTEAGSHERIRRRSGRDYLCVTDRYVDPRPRRRSSHQT